MTSGEIRQKFFEFMKEKRHAIVPSSSLIPDDGSVLLTTAGMQQFKPYLMGEADPQKDFGTKTVASIQKCFRTTDIDEVGDASHLTFFEMLGNFSFGSYFKEMAIPLSFEFLTSTQGLGLDPSKIFITAFKGDAEVPEDSEAISLWQEQFKKVSMEAKIGERIFIYGREKNWWEAGTGPAGPDAEMFYDFGLSTSSGQARHDNKFGEMCHPNCDCGRFVEIGNDVFVQYRKTEDGTYEPLSHKSVDNGRGLERLIMAVQGKNSIFETDLFEPLLQALPGEMPKRVKRILADHIRASVFLISDGVLPSNKETGYVLRRLLRRAMVHAHLFSVSGEMAHGKTMGSAHFLTDIAEKVILQYQAHYPKLNKDKIFAVILEEDERFHKTINLGLKELMKLTAENLDAVSAFRLYESYGLPFEVIKELDMDKAKHLTREAFEGEFKKHQEISRAGQEKKFGGHGLLLNTGELKAGNEEELKIVTRLHTATHMLQQALREVLGSNVHQAGSDITAERTRFDFTFPRKLTPEEIRKVEMLVNEKIKENLPMQKTVLPKVEAEKTGALYFFKEKYPDPVSVYFIGSNLENAWSKEFCGGPHVAHTGEVGEFYILKEEAVSSGVRRIRSTIK